jgi:enterochelin esterase-like enzyme
LDPAMRRPAIFAVAAVFVLSTVESATALSSSPPGPPIGFGTFASRALDGTVHYAVYLPSGYAKSSVRYPVVYFLHGLPASPAAYRSIQPVVQALQQSGRKAIVVGVQGASSDDSDPEWLDWGPGHNWETATAKELVRTVDSRYRTIASRRGRVLVGVSGGGYGAALIGLHNPGVFAVVESWSGYFHPTTPDGTAPLDLGSAKANARASAHTQLAKVRRLDYFAFYVGDGDSIFRAENEQFATELREAGIRSIVFRTYPGGHGWTLWSSHAPAWLANALDAAAKPRAGSA